MPAPTPQITLTATLIDFSGVAIGTAANPAYLRISLAGYGQRPPEVPGAGSIAKVASWPGDYPFTGTMLTIPLWGNDVVLPGPDITYYAISVLDTNKNVLQTACYRFDGTQTIDLSNAVPIVPAPVPPVPLPPVPVPGLQYLPCTPPAPQSAGTLYTAPGTIVSVYYNGIPQRKGIEYTQLNAFQFTLGFATFSGDSVYALVVVAGGTVVPLAYGAATPAPPQSSGATYTVPSGALGIVQVVYNGIAQRPGIDYTPTSATTFTLGFATFSGDSVYVLYTT